ncbi:hypothetical protein PG987_010067, partial [Apiospora arundinis]
SEVAIVFSLIPGKPAASSPFVDILPIFQSSSLDCQFAGNISILCLFSNVTTCANRLHARASPTNQHLHCQAQTPTNAKMSMDDTTLETLSYLEARLLRIEYVLYGHTAPSAKAPAITSLHQLEHRFATLLQRVSTYKDLLRIYQAHPDLFDPPRSTSAQAPSADSLLPPDALEQIVLAAAPSYPATASALTSIADTPVPEPALSASLAALLPRMKGIEATQAAQRAEMAELRARSEACVRQWYENSIVGYSDFVANAEGRIERVERGVRRVEKAREEV